MESVLSFRSLAEVICNFMKLIHKFILTLGHVGIFEPVLIDFSTAKDTADGHIDASMLTFFGLFSLCCP